MKTHLFALAAAMMMAGSTVLANHDASHRPYAEDVVSLYKADGFTRFEVRNGITQVKIEAYRNGEKVEIILDKTTGEILKRETSPVGAFENDTPGVFIRERNRDFLDADDDDSSDDNDSNDDEDSNDDDSNDDDSNDDNDDDRAGSDDDSDDDNDDDDSDNGSSDDNGDDDSSDD